MQQNIIKMEEPSSITSDLVKEHLCPSATDSELFLFVELCKKRKLNPWIKEAYLIKYVKDQPATIVVAYDVFLKRANQQADYRGYKAGLILKVEGKIERREGAFYEPQEKIVGGWCTVSREGKSEYRVEVPFHEYVGKKKDGTLNKQWATKPGTMMIKVPISQAHRLAYPNELGEMYSEFEMHGVNNFQGVSEIPKIKEASFVTKEQANEIEKKSILLGKEDKVLIALGVQDFSRIPECKYKWTIEHLNTQIAQIEESTPKEKSKSDIQE